jgi:hypothetical protein
MAAPMPSPPAVAVVVFCEELSVAAAREACLLALRLTVLTPPAAALAERVLARARRECLVMASHVHAASPDNAFAAAVLRHEALPAAAFGREVRIDLFRGLSARGMLLTAAARVARQAAYVAASLVVVSALDSAAARSAVATQWLTLSMAFAANTAVAVAADRSSGAAPLLRLYQFALRSSVVPLVGSLRGLDRVLRFPVPVPDGAVAAVKAARRSATATDVVVWELVMTTGSLAATAAIAVVRRLRRREHNKLEAQPPRVGLHAVVAVSRIAAVAALALGGPRASLVLPSLPASPYVWSLAASMLNR